MNFGTLLRQYRERVGISCSELARRAGLHYSYISRLEHGSRRPSLEAVERMVRALNLTAEECHALRVAAGYPPELPIPALADVFALLGDHGLSGDLRRAFSADLRALVDRYQALLNGRNDT
ncbi:MAG: helix-turn-helix transcriptional regulator [Dehalococcoidia bacterium]|nr:helix-turn-helix transcriptional regulator [Dehalococcoidia bacterium]